MATAMQHGTGYGQRKKMGWFEKRFYQKEMNRVCREIEQAREKLGRMYDFVGNFNDPATLLVGRRLDAIVIRYHVIETELNDKPPPVIPVHGTSSIHLTYSRPLDVHHPCTILSRTAGLAANHSQYLLESCMAVYFLANAEHTSLKVGACYTLSNSRGL